MRQLLRFPSPLIEPGVPICGIRLSDWIRHKPSELAIGNDGKHGLARVQPLKSRQNRLSYTRRSR